MSTLFNAAKINGSIGASTLVLNDYRLIISDIEGGHRLTVERGGEVQTMDVMDGNATSGTIDHRELTNRDAENQHPMSAIEGLEAALEEKQPKGDYILNTVADLVNYYTKSEVYTQAEVNELVSAIPKFKIEVVHSMQEMYAKKDPTTIYLFANSDSTYNIYSEYIFVDGAPELLGTQTLDLTGYATEAWVGEKLADYQPAGDYALKSDVPELPENIGTVKSVNGVEPDENGNVTIESGGVGKSLAGQTVYPTKDESVTAGDGAEIFNDLRERVNVKYEETSYPSEGNIASGDYSHAEGTCTTATGRCSHAEGAGTIATEQCSHAEGGLTVASGESAHAEGSQTTASGYDSHAEGDKTIASGNASHAEGYKTIASGNDAHAEGNSTQATGYNTHAEGSSTIAASDYQHVQGRFNISDKAGKYAHIVGNGSSETQRSNAHTIDWNGLGWFAGGLKVGGTGQDDETAEEVALKSDLENVKPSAAAVNPLTKALFNDYTLLYKYARTGSLGEKEEFNDAALSESIQNFTMLYVMVTSNQFILGSTYIPVSMFAITLPDVSDRSYFELNFINDQQNLFGGNVRYASDTTISGKIVGNTKALLVYGIGRVAN